MDLKAMLPSKS